MNTGAKWIDGKTIYKKTIETTDIPAANSEKNIPHNISNLSVVLRIESIGVASGNRFSPMPQTFNAMMFSSGALSMRVTDTNINISSNSNGCGQTKLYITLYYTKSS